MVREPIEQGCCHLGVSEDAWPFGKAEVGRDDDRGALVKPADQMEQQLAARLRERQITEFVEDDEINRRERIGGAALAVELDLGLQPIDQIDNIEVSRLAPGPDSVACNGDRDMRLACTGSANQDEVTLIVEEGAAAQALDQFGVDRRLVE